VALGAFLLFGVFSGDGPLNSAQLTPFLFFGLVFGLIIAVPVGLVGHAILYALKWRNMLAYLLVGGFASTSYALAVAVTDNMTSPRTLAIYAVLGVTCAAIAWLIRRPDKDAAP
jgi:H+/Cl- antiporter ClcA